MGHSECRLSGHSREDGLGAEEGSRSTEQIDEEQVDESNPELNLYDLKYVLTGTTIMMEALTMVKRDLLNEYSQVLELGSRSGKIGLHLAFKYGCSVTLADVDPRCRKVAGKLGELGETMTERHLAFNTVTADNTELPWPEKSFDLVFSEGLIEHPAPDDPRRVGWLAEMMRVSRDSVIVITNDADDQRTAERARENVYHYPTVGEKEYPYTAKELDLNLRLAGLQNVLVKKWKDARTQGYLIGAGTRAIANRAKQ